MNKQDFENWFTATGKPWLHDYWDDLGHDWGKHFASMVIGMILYALIKFFV